MAQPNRKISTNLEIFNQDSIPPTTPTPTTGETQLPRELLVEIFSYLPGTRSLLRCRLVCRSWKEAVDSSPKLMRKLTVAVYHPSLFLDLNNFAHRVKAIRLREALPSTMAEQNNFFTCIAKTVEKVVFDILSNNEFFNLENLVPNVFLRCEALKEIEIVQSRFQLIACGLDQLDDEVFQVASAKVKVITTDWYPGEESHQNELETFLLRLGNLSTIRFTSYREQQTLKLPIEAFRFIATYMDKYPGILKRIYLPNSISDIVVNPMLQFSLPAENAEYFRVIFLASSQGIVINDRNIRCELNKMFEFEATQELKLDTLKYFSNFSVARIVFPVDPLSPFHRLILCTNIREIFLEIKGSNNPVYHRADLQCLNYMHGVERLTIYSSSPQVRIASVISVGNDQILWNWASYASSLKQLTIHYHRFEASYEVEAIVCTFPHLTYVKFESTHGADVNFIVALTKLDKLEEIVLVLIDDLTDEAFTLPCEVVTDSQQEGQVQSVPAIAALKGLKRLKILQCSLLTDSCLVEGISKARSSQSVEVLNCVGITTVGFDSLLAHMEGTPTPWGLRAFRKSTRKWLG